jgi:hypothetical protein
LDFNPRIQQIGFQSKSSTNWISIQEFKKMDFNPRIRKIVGVEFRLQRTRFKTDDAFIQRYARRNISSLNFGESSGKLDSRCKNWTSEPNLEN